MPLNTLDHKLQRAKFRGGRTGETLLLVKGPHIAEVLAKLAGGVDTPGEDEPCRVVYQVRARCWEGNDPIEGTEGHECLGHGVVGSSSGHRPSVTL